MAKSMGRPSIFGRKDGERIQGVLTQPGTELFEAARQKLAEMSGFATVSDGDVVEFLARGVGETRAILKGK